AGGDGDLIGVHADLAAAAAASRVRPSRWRHPRRLSARGPAGGAWPGPADPVAGTRAAVAGRTSSAGRPRASTTDGRHAAVTTGSDGSGPSRFVGRAGGTRTADGLGAAGAAAARHGIRPGWVRHHCRLWTVVRD